MEKLYSKNQDGSLSEFLTGKAYVAIPLKQNIAGLLLVDAAINGVKGTYILDTGAGQTVVDRNQIANLKLELKHDETAQTGGGVGASGIENIPSYNNNLEINTFKLEPFTVAVMSLETAWQSLANVGANEILYGIIGYDVLKPGKAIIDYGTMTLYLIN